MTQLNVRAVDPRDGGWEIDTPSYRVYFWRRFGGGHASREYEVSGGDVGLVLEWAAENSSDDETYVVYARIARGDDSGMVRLAGTDPTRAEGA